MRPELGFVLAPRQHLALEEFARALHAEAQRTGARASLHTGGFPPPRSDLIQVIIAPHEYFTLMHGRHGPLPEALRRTMFVFTDPPDTQVFESDVDWAARAGASFSTNSFAARAFAEQGLHVEHLPIGWTPAWDHVGQEGRDIDVLFMGSLTDRRARALASYAKTLSRHRCQLDFADISWPTWAQTDAFHVGDEKWARLRRAKVLINIHQEPRPYLEWLRIAQAMSCGAVVVSEHSVDCAPLVPGRHLLMGDVTVLHLLAEMLLGEPDRLRRIQAAGYSLMRNELRLATSVEKLLAAATVLAESEPVPDGRHRFFTQPQPDRDAQPALNATLQPRGRFDTDPELAALRRAVKALRLDMLGVRRTLAGAELALAGRRANSNLEPVAVTAAYPAALPRVSILTAVYNHASLVASALASVRNTRRCSYEVVIVDDGSDDGSAEAVATWLDQHQDVPGLLLRHPVNRGLGHARNSALGVARGELCFVLDADNEVYPHCLCRLAEALDADPGAAFAYGTLETFTDDQPVGLMNTMPWQPRRLRLGNYIDAMAMLRTAVVREEIGGYPTDSRLHGWEDFALWCALASAGHRGVRVGEIVARYRVSPHSMLSLTDLSTTDAFSVIIAANPDLMAGAIPPD